MISAVVSGESLTVVASAGAAAFVLVAVFTEFTRRFALRLKIVDRPGAYRPHRRPTPRLGGPAVAAGTLLPTTALAGEWNLQLIMIMMSGVLVALLGVIHDCRRLRPAWRLAIESVAATLVVASGVRVEIFGAWIDMAGTLLWIVFVANAFAMIDNTDGVLGGVGAVGAGILAVTALASGQTAFALFLFSLACGCVGFAAHGWSPARIRMGKAGPLFIGFTLAASAVAVSGQAGPVTVVPALLLFAFVPVLDICLAVATRQRAGRPWLLAGPDHLAHRCVAAGLTARQVALVMSAAATATGLLGMYVMLGRVPGAVALPGVVCAGAGLLAFLVRMPGRYPVAPLRARRLGRVTASAEGRG
ncbi:glycosyltransferase family 4 protein [Streptosporangium sp. NPDC001559]|uniref:glycosyltransferase family 4 protein n=1 Tax=Streptosporangium sp. NPDC001559 TaxID=3366187 RepID=UPI0036E4B2B7